jgi:probable phosphoglycerate mutase
MARALPTIRSVVTRHKEQTVAIVSHKATIRLVLSSVLGIDARGYRDRLDLAPASLNVIDFKDAVRARLMLYNDTSHYAERPRTADSALSKWWNAKA